MPLRGATVRRYLEALRDASNIAGSTEHTHRAPLLEAMPPPDVRFEGAGSGRVQAPRFDEATSSVWINADLRFTGVTAMAWEWGGAFRPLEHFLVDRRGKVLDVEQIQMYQQAINAVRTSIEMAPELDQALDAVLADTLDIELTS